MIEKFKHVVRNFVEWAFELEEDEEDDGALFFGDTPRVEPVPVGDAANGIAYPPPDREEDEEEELSSHRRKRIKIGCKPLLMLIVGFLVGLVIFIGFKACGRFDTDASRSAIALSDSDGETFKTADASKAGASSKDANKTDEEMKEVEETINALTVEKMTDEDLDSLTADKYKDVSWIFLDSSLSTHDRARIEATGFSDALTYGFSAKDDAKRFLELQEEILRNPVYGVTVVNALRDKTIGGKTVQSFNPWMKEMADLNSQYGVSYWLEKEGDTIYVTREYRIYAATLCTWLERLISQGPQTRQTVENWCLNASARNSEREGIKASYQYNDRESLVFAYIGKNKGSGDESLLVIGFNIHDKRPEFFGDSENPVKTTPAAPTPSGEKPSGSGGNKPSDPDKPDEPAYNKDPNKAPKENTEPNDDPGPGPSTNNGVGATESTADRPTNSNHGSYPDYQDDIKDLEEINQSQSTGSDPSTPSTPAPSPGANVDNNGDSGTETSAPINNPTPVAPPATEAGSGEPINSSPGEAWGGPAD